MNNQKRKSTIDGAIQLAADNLRKSQNLVSLYGDLLRPSDYSELVRHMVFAPSQHSIEFQCQRPLPVMPSSSRSSSRTSNRCSLEMLFLCKDSTFQEIMKVSREKLTLIYNELQEIGTNPSIKVTGLFGLLYYLTDPQSSYRQMAGMLEVDVDVIEGLIEETARLVAVNLQEFAGIQWPEDMTEVINGFHRAQKYTFVRTAGVLGHENLGVSRGPSVMLQIVVDHKGLIRYFKVDSTTDPVELLESSSLYDVLRVTPERWFVLCDASYPRLENLLPPYSGDMRSEEKEFNEIHLETRQVLNEAFDNLFNFFPKLRNLDSPSVAIVGAGLVFYNVIRRDL